MVFNRIASIVYLVLSIIQLLIGEYIGAIITLLFAGMFNSDYQHDVLMEQIKEMKE